MNESVKNLMLDYALNKEIFNEGEKISSDEINSEIRKACFEILGIDEHSTRREVSRALKTDKRHELFAVIEEIIDGIIIAGFEDNAFFNEYVDRRDVADGDAVEFYVDQETYLNVAKVAGDHHDLIMQKLAEGTPFTVPTSVYAVKVGSDIRLFLTGKKDWAKWVDAAAKAIVREIMAEAYAEVMNASSQMPSSAQFNKAGTLSNVTKDTFDTLIEDVEAANGTDVMILGTKTALKKLNGLALVNWIADSQKEAYANTGFMGSYEGTVLMEIPQRFVGNDTATKLVDNDKLLIMPMVNDNKFVKLVDYGETTLEVTEIGETMNDQQSYEIQRRMGVGVVISRYFGTWTIQ